MTIGGSEPSLLVVVGAALTAAAAAATCSFVFFVLDDEISPSFFLIFITAIEGEGSAFAGVAGWHCPALACVSLRLLAQDSVGLRLLALHGFLWLAENW
jgi:hypothetical protein